MLNETDILIINWLRKMMHAYLPFTNDYIFGFPFGEYAFYMLLVYIIANIWLIKQPKNKAVKR